MSMNYSESRKRIGYALLKKASEPKAKKLSDAINFMAENMSDKNFEVISRSMKILEEGFKKPDPDSSLSRFSNMVEKWMKQEFDKDMIYYSVCYDRFRL